MSKFFLLAILSLSFVNCTTNPTGEEEGEQQQAEASAPAVAVAERKKPVSEAEAEAKSQEKSGDKGVDVTTPPPEPAKAPAPAPAHAAAAHTSAPEGVAPEVSLRWLRNGNIRFAKRRLRSDGQSMADVKKLANGQKPHAIILSCSDSRVPPEIIFDQKLGEIFVIRTAGEAVDDNVVASIEYAVMHLGSRVLVVMGHSSCGAVNAALQTLDGADVGSPALNNLVKSIHPHLQSFKDAKPSPGLEKEVWANTKGVASDLLGRSNILAEKVKAGDLKMVTALYDLASGQVEFTP